jgi:transcriptional regulator with XRE-family HTH domain
MTAPIPHASLGQIIRARRAALGLSQEMLAARVRDLGGDITQADVSRIELGRVELPRRRRLERLASALGLSLGELLEASGWMGAVERFNAADPPLAPQPRASFAPEQPSPRELQPAPSPDWPVLTYDAPSPMDTLVRLRTAISRAHEPVDRAARLLHDCQETAERWDLGLPWGRATVNRPPAAQPDTADEP